MIRYKDETGKYAWRKEEVIPEVVETKDLVEEQKEEVSEALKEFSKKRRRK